MNGAGGGLSAYFEGAIAATVAVIFVIMAMLTLKERHRDIAAWHVYLGAAIYGLLYGLIVGFVIVPFRVLLTSGDVPPQTAAYSAVGFLVVMIALRRGVLARLPFLGPQVKAYRRASLRRSIETAQKQLDKLTPKPVME
ncbi:MAG: hypothetical protein AB7P23_08720 [Amphiplicatus sp.]